MPLYEWSPNYSTSIRVIDNDHRDLFEAINTLHDAHEAGQGAERVAATIDCLIRYVDEHFEREERFMEQAGYPDFASHCQSHAEFAGMIRVLHQIYLEDPMAVNIPKVLNFLADWLTQHIQKIDMKYVPYVTGEKAPLNQQEQESLVMRTVKVPEDQVELVQEIVEFIATHRDKKESLQAVFSEFNKQTEQSLMDKAKKLFCNA